MMLKNAYVLGKYIVNCGGRAMARPYRVRVPHGWYPFRVGTRLGASPTDEGDEEKRPWRRVARSLLHILERCLHICKQRPGPDYGKNE